MLTANHVSVKILKELGESEKEAIKKCKRFLSRADNDAEKYWRFILKDLFLSYIMGGGMQMQIKMDRIAADLNALRIGNENVEAWESLNQDQDLRNLIERIKSVADPYVADQYNDKVCGTGPLAILGNNFNDEINILLPYFIKQDSDLFITLKNSCMNYIARDSTIFADAMKMLPEELMEEVINVRNRNYANVNSTS